MIRKGIYGVLLVLLVAPFFSWLSPEALESHLPRVVKSLWLQKAQIGASLLSSTVFSLGAVLFSIFLSWGPARILAFSHFRGKAFLEGLLLSPAILPMMTFSLGFHRTLLLLGGVDRYWGVVLVLTALSYPYMLRALVSGFITLGQEPLVTAENLGAGGWQVFWEVEVPALLPAAGAGAHIVFLAAFSDYFLVFLIGGGRVDSFSGYLFPVLRSSDTLFSGVLLILFLLIPLVLFVLEEALLKKFDYTR